MKTVSTKAMMKSGHLPKLSGVFIKDKDGKPKNNIKHFRRIIIYEYCGCT